jgi:hypothetical protein
MIIQLTCWLAVHLTKKLNTKLPNLRFGEIFKDKTKYLPEYLFNEANTKPGN